MQQNASSGHSQSLIPFGRKPGGTGVQRRAAGLDALENAQANLQLQIPLGPENLAVEPRSCQLWQKCCQLLTDRGDRKSQRNDERKSVVLVEIYIDGAWRYWY